MLGSRPLPAPWTSCAPAAGGQGAQPPSLPWVLPLEAVWSRGLSITQPWVWPKPANHRAPSSYTQGLVQGLAI